MDPTGRVSQEQLGHRQVVQQPPVAVNDDHPRQVLVVLTVGRQARSYLRDRLARGGDHQQGCHHPTGGSLAVPE